MISTYDQATDQIQDDEECYEAKTQHDLKINIEDANRSTRFIPISVASIIIRSLTDGGVDVAVDGGS